MQKIISIIAAEIKASAAQVQAAVDLLDSGATVPFIARYRKEATGGLDDTQLRDLQTRLEYLRELEERRATVLHSIQEQGKMTAELQAAILSAATKQELEDIYLPYKPKRRSKGLIAREAGIEPLADALWADPNLDPQTAAIPYVLQPDQNPEGGDFSSVAQVLDGVRDILSERWAEDTELVQTMRSWLWEHALFESKKLDKADENHPETAKFRDYFDYAESVAKVPSHRALAVFRGRSLDVLDVKLVLPEDLSSSDKKQPSIAEGHIAQHLHWTHQARSADDLLRKCVSWTWRVKLSLSLERDIFSRLREQSETVAIAIFAQNLRHLLLAAPAGKRVVMGLDPGIRTGVKVAVVDETGKVVATDTVYPHEPRKDWDGALFSLAKHCEKLGVNLIAIGNGTASRETDQLAADLIKRFAQGGVKIEKLVVSEAGASVYSASEYASKELPDLDVSLRGAVSIARRVQDPLAELVKIDPKSIGVGQYQHDVSQSQLAKSLDAVVEDCVNSVGVDVNTASAPLLTRVSGLSATTARAIVLQRERAGAFKTRAELLHVTGLGAKTFEQSAGFLRIQGGDNPLDCTGVHPESYAVVERMLASTSKTVQDFMGHGAILKTLRPEHYADDQVGIITVRDILSELEKPGRDPRPDFVVARFNEGVSEIHDLREGMLLEGTISNVAAFGAFVDIGVHQDGLVHVSQLASKFVKDPAEVVKAGDIVKVRVLEIDAARKRISLTMRINDVQSPAGTTDGIRFEAARAGARAGGRGAGGGGGGGGAQRGGAGQGAGSGLSAMGGGNAMSAAFAKLQTLKK